MKLAGSTLLSLSMLSGTAVAQSGLATATPAISCTQENGLQVCRPSGASFVWCKSAEDLANLETAVDRDPMRTPAAITEASAGGRCGLTASVEMNRYNRPEKTAEGQLHPEISRRVFLVAANLKVTARDGCRAPGFCAVKPGPAVWACPEAKGLDLSAGSRKKVGCLQVSAGNAAEVLDGSVSDATVTLSYGQAPLGQGYYTFATSDLIAVDINPAPVNGGRGWCAPGDWCVTVAPTLFCSNRPAYDRVLAIPSGEARRVAITAEEGCRIAMRGNPMKVSTSAYESKIVEVQHPVFGEGHVSRDAFMSISWSVPIKVTVDVTDILVAAGKAPSYAGVEVQRQGSSKAWGLFRTGLKQIQAYCSAFRSDDERACVRSTPPEEIVLQADCKNMVVTVFDRTWRLFERPKDGSVGHINDRRQWIWRDVANDEWANGSSSSGEITIDSGFNALCPGVNPEMSVGIVHRNPLARFPDGVLGEWVSEETCREHRVDREFTDGLTTIGPRERKGHEQYEIVNLVRRTGSNSWSIDASASGEGGEEWQSSTEYSLQRDGLYVEEDGDLVKLVRCPPLR